MPKEPEDIPEDRSVVVPDGVRPTIAELVLARDPHPVVVATALALCLIALGVIIGLAIAPSLGH